MIRKLVTYSNIKYFFCSKASTKKQSQSILLTGLQPTGSLHLGNYFGSILNVLKYQEDSTFNKRFVFIADLHSMTMAFTHDNASIQYKGDIGKDSYSMIKTLIASGLNPQKTTLFIQSHVPEHSELAWILSCFANQHALNFMVQYKEKGNQYSSVGLYTYPLLMASDILIYKSTHVPVGLDQLQHIQLTNKIRQRFNRIVKSNYFPHVKYVEAKQAKVMSLTNPEKKMSKSDVNQRSRINLTDSLKLVQQKIRRAVTDAEGSLISYEPQKRKGLSNLIDIYALFKDMSQQQVVNFAQQSKWGIADLKSQLTKQIWKVLQQIQRKSQALDQKKINKVIQQGYERSRAQASKNIKDIKKLLRLI